MNPTTTKTFFCLREIDNGRYICATCKGHDSLAIFHNRAAALAFARQINQIEFVDARLTDLDAAPFTSVYLDGQYYSCK